MNAVPSPSEDLEILFIQCNLGGGAHFGLAIDSSGLRTRLRVIDDRLEAVRAVCDSIRAGEVLPDLILAEIDLRRESGRELVRSVRSCSELSCVPLIVIGDGDTVDDEIWARELGAAGFIARPVCPSDLQCVAYEIEDEWSSRYVTLN